MTKLIVLALALAASGCDKKTAQCRAVVSGHNDLVSALRKLDGTGEPDKIDAIATEVDKATKDLADTNASEDVMAARDQLVAAGKKLGEAVHKKAANLKGAKDPGVDKTLDDTFEAATKEFMAAKAALKTACKISDD